jgi:hypothetical protein
MYFLYLNMYTVQQKSRQKMFLEEKPLHGAMTTQCFGPIHLGGRKMYIQNVLYVQYLLSVRTVHDSLWTMYCILSTFLYCTYCIVQVSSTVQYLLSEQYILYSIVCTSTICALKYPILYILYDASSITVCTVLYSHGSLLQHIYLQLHFFLLHFPIYPNISLFVHSIPLKKYSNTTLIFDMYIVQYGGGGGTISIKYHS